MSQYDESSIKNPLSSTIGEIRIGEIRIGADLMADQLKVETQASEKNKVKFSDQLYVSQSAETEKDDMEEGNGQQNQKSTKFRRKKMNLKHPSFAQNKDSKWRDDMKEWCYTDSHLTDEAKDSYMPSHWIFYVIPFRPIFTSWWKKSLDIGGAEQIALYLQQLQLDTDGDGILSDEEIEEGIEKSKEIVENVLKLLETCGIIGALMMSLLFQWFFTDINYSKAAMSSMSSNVLGKFKYGAFICLCLSFLTATNAVILSLSLYRQISFYLPSLRSKLWYLRKVSLVPVVVSAIATLTFAAFALPFGATVAISPFAGIISGFGFLGVVAALMYTEHYTAPIVTARQHADCREIFDHQDKMDESEV